MKKKRTPPESFDIPDASLEQAKEWLRERFKKKGAHCPCCRRFVKLYPRPISSDMARGAIALYSKHRELGWDQWLHIPTIMNEACPSNMGSLLRFWDLIEPQGGVRDDGSSRTGFYRMTTAGRGFVEGTHRVVRHMFIYNQRLLRRGSPDDTVSIWDCLKNKFNYDELMGTRTS